MLAARHEAGQRLGGERIEPGQPILTRHREHPPVAEGGDGPPFGERALLGERIADVPEPGVVDDRAGYRREDLGHHSAFASRADACEPRSAPSAAMSHAHSRCWSTRPYILVAAP